MLINNAVITGSFIVNGVDVTGITGSSAISSSYLALSSSYVITSASYAQSSASLSIRTSNLEATASTLTSASSSFAADSASLSTRLTGDETNISTLTTASASFAAQSSSLSTRLTTDETNFTNLSSSFATTSGSLSTRVTNLEVTSSVVSSSFATTSGSISSRVTIIEGQDATTGSNIFTGPQYVNQASNAISFTSTASLYTDGGLRVSKDSFVSGTAYFNNVVVYGTSSIQYITSSQVNFGTNIITVNTDTPAVRFGGLAVFDSGSTQLTGSMLWDSEKNHWIYSNPSGSTYNSAMLMNGPRNTGSLGNEQGTTSCALMMGQGGDHITSSMIYSYGNATCFYGTSYISASGDACFASTVCAPSFIGGTMSGTTIYGSTAVCSAVGKFTTCIDAGKGTFSNSNLKVGSLAASGNSGIEGGIISTASLACVPNSLTLSNYNASSTGHIKIELSDFDKSSAFITYSPTLTSATNLLGLYVGSIGTGLQINGSGAATFSSTITGTTIYGSTAVCSPVGLFSGCVGVGTQTPQSILHAQSGANVWSFNGGCACTPYNNNSNGFYTNAGNISITNQYGTINWPEDYTTLSTTKPWWMLGNRSGTVGQWQLTLRTGYSGSGGLDREVIGVYTTGTDTARTIACIRLSTGAGVEAMKIDSAGAATFSSTITGTTIYGSTAVCSPVGKFTSCVDACAGYFSGVLQVRNTSSTPSIWSGQYGGAISILGDNATSNRYIDLSIVDSTGALATQGMRITSGGNVGIGTCSPLATLVVGTQSTGTDGASFAADNSIVSRVGASYSGNTVVGLTIANTAAAAVNNEAALSFIVAGNYSATGMISTILTTTAGSAASDMTFKTYNSTFTEKMRITSGGKILVGTASTANTGLGTYTKQSIVGDGSINAAASHGSMFVAAGTGTADTGISVNQSTSGMTMMLLASINTSTGTSTNSAVYIVRFYFSGNNTPTATYIGGSSDFVTFGQSGSNTLTLTGSSSGNKSYAWFVNKFGDT